jgi:hypothetical protein
MLRENMYDTARTACRRNILRREWMPRGARASRPGRTCPSSADREEEIERLVWPRPRARGRGVWASVCCSRSATRSTSAASGHGDPAQPPQAYVVASSSDICARDARQRSARATTALSAYTSRSYRSPPTSARPRGAARRGRTAWRAAEHEATNGGGVLQSSKRGVAAARRHASATGRQAGSTPAIERGRRGAASRTSSSVFDIGAARAATSASCAGRARPKLEYS